MAFRVQGLGFRVWGVELKVPGWDALIWSSRP